MLDAIVRTAWRLLFSHRHLLEWMTAAQANSSARPGPFQHYLSMLPGLVLGIGACAVAWILNPAASPLPLAFGILWAAAPALARAISLPRGPEAASALTAAQAQALRLIARRTWRYFETFVTPEENFLPPTVSRKPRARRLQRAPRPPTSGSTFCRPSPRMTWAGSASVRLSCGYWTPCRRSRACPAFAGIFTTGTTPATCVCSTGVAFIALAGGSAEAARLAVIPPDDVPVIRSESSTVQTLMEDAPSLLAEAIALISEVRRFITPDNREAVARILNDLGDASGRIEALASRAEVTLAAVEATLAQADAALLAAETGIGHADAILTDQSAPCRRRQGTAAATAASSDIFSAVPPVTQVAQRDPPAPRRGQSRGQRRSGRASSTR